MLFWLCVSKYILVFFGCSFVKLDLKYFYYYLFIVNLLVLVYWKIYMLFFSCGVFIGKKNCFCGFEYVLSWVIFVKVLNGRKIDFKVVENSF